MKQKAIILGALVLALLLTIFVFKNQLFKLNPVSQHCKPWRSITGYYLLCKELNAVSNCDYIDCSGTSIITVKTNFQLQNSQNVVFSFLSNQSISMLMQSDVISAGNNWAFANIPLGYYFSGIQYSPNVAVPIGGQTAAFITIIVTYKKCTGNNISAK